METIGFVGVGKIGMPISENLIKSGYRVLGFRRSSLAEFEKIGGVPAKSAADVGAQCDIVFSCLPSTEALDDAMQGPNGLIKSARAGQVVVEEDSHCALYSAGHSRVPPESLQSASRTYLRSLRQ